MGVAARRWHNCTSAASRTGTTTTVVQGEDAGGAKGPSRIGRGGAAYFVRPLARVGLGLGLRSESESGAGGGRGGKVRKEYLGSGSGLRWGQRVTVRIRVRVHATSACSAHLPHPLLSNLLRASCASASYTFCRTRPLCPLCAQPLSNSPTSLGHQAKESSCSFGTLVLIGVAAVCAVLTPFSARGLHAAG